MSNRSFPDSWAQATLGDVSDFKNGRAFKSTDWAKTGLPIIRIQNVNAIDPNTTEYNYFQGEYDNSILVDFDDLLFCWSGSLGTSFGPRIWKGPKGVLNQHIFKVLLKNGIDKKFYFYQMKSNIHLVEQRAHGGVGLTHITKSELTKVPFVVPPSGEQKRIVKKIESVESQINKIKECIERGEELVPRFQNAILEKAFRGELVPQLNNGETALELLKSIQTESAKNPDAKKPKVPIVTPINLEDVPFQIPKSWEWVRLGDIVRVSSGDNLTSANQRAGEIPVFGGNGIAGYHDVSNVESESIVIGRVGAKCGVVHITPRRAWVTDNALIVSPKIDVNQNWLASALSWLNLNDDANRSAQPVISGQKIYSRLIPLPPRGEQEAIICKIESHVNNLKDLSNKLSFIKVAVENQFRSILTKAFLGSLVPQISSEGTGHDLLKEITLMCDSDVKIKDRKQPKGKNK